jgi:hypothetical protein
MKRIRMKVKIKLYLGQAKKCKLLQGKNCIVCSILGREISFSFTKIRHALGPTKAPTERLSGVFFLR